MLGKDEMKKEIRVVDKEKNILQVTTADERWYGKEVIDDITGLPKIEWIPSVTWKSEYYPKGIEFYKWLANKGWDESISLKEAAGDKGSKVHTAIVDLIDGEEISINDKYLNPRTKQDEELTLEEYECLMSFVKWFKKTNPKVINKEFVVWGDNYAGTVDLLCEIDEESYIIDFKTSQNIWPSMELQVSAYKHAMKENHKIAILQLGYKKNKDKYKFTPIEDCFEEFKAASILWAKDNKDVAPKQRDYPLSIKL